MIRYIIRQKETGKFLRRTKSYGVRSEWVDNADDATLITTGSAASQIADKFCDQGTNSSSFRMSRQSWMNFPVEVIKVQCLLIPVGQQPFINGVSNGHISK